MRIFIRLATGAFIIATAIMLTDPSRISGRVEGRTEGTDGRAVCGKALARIIPGLEPDEIVPVWIFFDRTSGGSKRDKSSSFSPRSVRRTMMRGSKRERFRCLDPPRDDYVSGIRPYVERIRNRSVYFNAVSADVRGAKLADLMALPFVASMDMVRTYRRERESLSADAGRSDTAPSALNLQTPQFGIYGESFGQLYMVEAIDLLEMGYNGSGDSSSAGQVMIGVLDTGFFLDHEAFNMIDVYAQYDFINDDYITSNELGDPVNQDRHGTLVLGVLAGYHEGDLMGPAWGATYLLAKTEIVDVEIKIEEDNWIAGLEWCDSIGADIVTSSLGYIAWYTPDSLDGETALCTRAANWAASKGIIVCNAAGNYGPGSQTLIAPADADSVIAVGGVYGEGTYYEYETLWYSSSRGPTADGRIKPDLLAQSVAVHTVLHPERYGYGKYNGTSFAAPMVAGLCAQLLEIHPEWSPMQIKDSLLVHASNSESPDNNYGWGIARGLATSGLAAGISTTPFFSNGYPNPFSDAVTFDLYSDRWTYISILIYDNAGRLVRALIKDQPLVFGATVEWNGLNSRGSQVASGVYFVEFISPQMRQTTKVVRLR